MEIPVKDLKQGDKFMLASHAVYVKGKYDRQLGRYIVYSTSGYVVGAIEGLALVTKLETK